MYYTQLRRPSEPFNRVRACAILFIISGVCLFIFTFYASYIKASGLFNMSTDHLKVHKVRSLVILEEDDYETAVHTQVKIITYSNGIERPRSTQPRNSEDPEPVKHLEHPVFEDPNKPTTPGKKWNQSDANGLTNSTQTTLPSEGRARVHELELSSDEDEAEGATTADPFEIDLSVDFESVDQEEYPASGDQPDEDNSFGDSYTELPIPLGRTWPPILLKAFPSWEVNPDTGKPIYWKKPSKPSGPYTCTRGLVPKILGLKEDYLSETTQTPRSR